MHGKQMRQAKRGFILAASAALALAGCAAQQEDVASADGSAHAAGTHHAAQDAVPGGVARWGDSIATMADQYRPRTTGVTVAAAGASAWVPPAPSPAFVVAGPLPPADPPARPPAAVANRQPAAGPPAAAPAAPPALAPRPAVTPAPAPARPAVAASDIVRPEAAAPTPPPSPAAAPDPAVRTRGLALFNTYSCNACHALADARAAGSIGPAFDRNPLLTKPYTVEVITTGRGAMPAFAGQMTDAEIAAVADYIVQFARK